MALRTKIKNLFIPRKTQDPAKQPGYGTDMRAIEQWALEVLNYLNNNGIIEIVAGSGVTVTNPFGPVTTISASGGGSGITTLTSPDASITITNPAGPVASIDVEGWPFPPFEDGLSNVGYGPAVLFNITTGDFNAAFGVSALNADTSGSANAAFGYNALNQVTTGADNTAVGNNAAAFVTTGNSNIGIGHTANVGSGSASENVIIGAQAGLSSTGSANVAVGYQALASVTTGNSNVAVGLLAGPTTNLSATTCLGTGTGAQASGGVAIGADHAGHSALAVAQDDFVLGTFNHVVVFPNNATGSHTVNLGSNSPATGATPFGWIVMRAVSGGTLGYIPFWQ